MTESGIRKLAFDLFKDEGHASLVEARSIVQLYRNGGGVVEIMQAIRESKAKLGVPSCSKRSGQVRLNGV